MPKVSVLLPVHDGLPYLPEAVESVLAQSLADFELILIDDGSQDGTSEYLDSLRDERILMYRHKGKKGLGASLNMGMAAAQGEFMARMDADDISEPDRLEKQVAYMEAHPELSLCGTWARTFGEGREQLWRYPEKDAEIKAEMLFASVLVHGSVLLRSAQVRELGIRYDESLPAGQDYALWAEIQDRARFANVPEFLLRYRIHPAQVGGQRGGQQQEVADRVREQQLARLGVTASGEEKALHHGIARWEFSAGLDGLDAIEPWLLRLLRANEESRFLEPLALGRAGEKRWWAASRGQAGLGWAAWRRYRDSEIAKMGPRSVWDQGEFATKSLAYSLGLRR